MELDKARSKEDILDAMSGEMPWVLNPKIEPYILEAMEIYTQSELSQAKKDREDALKFLVEVNKKANPDSNWGMATGKLIKQLSE